MTTLRQILDDTLELLKNPKYRTIGDLQKAKYQAYKKEHTDDPIIRQMLYQGGLGNSEEAKQKAKITHQKKVESGEWAEQVKRAAQTRAAWYKDPENYACYKKILSKKRKKKS